MLVPQVLQPIQFNWDATSGGISTNTADIENDEVLLAVTVASDTSGSGPAAVEILTLNRGSGTLSTTLEHGMIWNGDLMGQVTWDRGPLGPFSPRHQVRVAVRNDTGATISVFESILKGKVVL